MEYPRTGFLMKLLKKKLLAIEKLGIHFIKGHLAPTVHEITKKHDVCVLAVGLNKSQLPDVTGKNLKVFFLAKDVLQAHKLHKPIKVGKNVIVVGGGNSALDAAQAAKVLALKMSLFSIDEQRLKCRPWEREIDVAKALGVQFRYLTIPLEIFGRENVEGMKCQLMKLSVKNRFRWTEERGAIGWKPVHFRCGTLLSSESVNL